MLLCQEQECACLQHQLLDCIENKKNIKAKRLLKKIKNPWNLVDDTVSTLLHYAVRCSNITMINHLIKIGCNINAQDSDGSTPLSLIVRTQNVDVAKTLLNNNADIFITDFKGVSCLHIVCQECIFYKLPGVARIPSQVILEIFFQKLNHDFVRNKRKITELILDANDIVKFAAIVFGDVQLMTYIIDNGFDINCTIDSSKKTALHCAIIFHKFENAKVLINRGINVNAQDFWGRTALIYYTSISEYYDENAEILKIMLKRLNNLTALDEDGISYLEPLLRLEKKKIVKALLENDENIIRMNFSGGKSLVHVLVENKNDNVLDVFDELRIQFDEDARDSNGDTALIIAASNISVKQVEFLLKHNADVNLRSYNSKSAMTAAVSGLINNIKRQSDAKKVILLLLQYRTCVRADIIGLLQKLADQSRNSPHTEDIIAHLSLLKSGNEFKFPNYANDIIKCNTMLKNIFGMYEEKLEDTKNISVYGTVTLFQLLTESDKKILAYARNQEFISALNTKINGYVCDSRKYYVDTIRRRITRALDMIKMLEKVALIIEALTGISSDAYHTIIYNIISNLKLNDLKNLCRIENVY